MRSHRHILPRHHARRVHRPFSFGAHLLPFPLQPPPHAKPAQAFLPLVVALYHSLRHPSLRQYPAWSADTRMRSPLDRVFGFVFNGSTRYIIPSLLLAISTFLVSIKSTTLRSSYICPIANADATAVPSLQFVGFLLDCLILQVLYRLVDDGVSEPDDWSILLQDGTSNHVLVGMTFIVGRVSQISTTPFANHIRPPPSFLLLPALSSTPQCPSIASGCFRFLPTISLVFCVYR